MKKIFLFVVLVLSLTSCQKTVYLTGSLMHNLQENELDLTRIQFYNDNPLVLEREVPSSNANIKSGKVFFKNGRYINRISLDKNTPGMVQREENGSLLITFEQSSDGENWLRFGAVPGEKGEYFYQLIDQKGSPSFSRIDYEGNMYLVIYPTRVRLLLAKSVLTNLKIKERHMKGVRVK